MSTKSKKQNDSQLSAEQKTVKSREELKLRKNKKGIIHQVSFLFRISYEFRVLKFMSQQQTRNFECPHSWAYTLEYANSSPLKKTSKCCFCLMPCTITFEICLAFLLNRPPLYIPSSFVSFLDSFA